MIIAIDFDGTCVAHEYPEVGHSIGAEPVIEELAKRGHKLILFTMRSGDHLQDAVDWFDRIGVPLWGVNQNPQQSEWTTSPKVYAQVYIDDAALGCPLVHPPNGKRPFIDWSAVSVLLERIGV